MLPIAIVTPAEAAVAQDPLPAEAVAAEAPAHPPAEAAAEARVPLPAEAIVVQVLPPAEAVAAEAPAHHPAEAAEVPVHLLAEAAAAVAALQRWILKSIAVYLLWAAVPLMAVLPLLQEGAGHPEVQEEALPQEAETHGHEAGLLQADNLLCYYSPWQAYDYIGLLIFKLTK